MPVEILHPDARTMAEAVADRIAGLLRAALAERTDGSPVGLAVPGGRSPLGTFAALARRTDVDWRRVTVTPTDERRVADDDPARNAATIRALLTDRVGARLLDLKTDAPTPAAAAEEVEALLADFPRPAAAVLLGMGVDGHVASLFPGSPATAVPPGRRCVATRSPLPPHERLSLTPAALLDARRVVLLLPGAAKRALWSRIRDGVESPPAAFLLAATTPVEIHATDDDDAAGTGG